MVFFNPGHTKLSDVHSRVADARRSTLGDYKATFGAGQGCAYLVDEIPFVDACLQQMKKQDATNAAQEREIVSLKSRIARLSAVLQAVRNPSGQK